MICVTVEDILCVAHCVVQLGRIYRRQHNCMRINECWEGGLVLLVSGWFGF